MPDLAVTKFPEARCSQEKDAFWSKDFLSLDNGEVTIRGRDLFLGADATLDETDCRRLIGTMKGTRIFQQEDIRIYFGDIATFN